MSKQVFYVTTPIYYVNAEPHLGHAYTTIVADTLNRFYRLLNIDTRFQTGTDEYGNKIVQAAVKEGLAPQQYVDKISDIFQQTWIDLGITVDNFIRTTNDNHITTVQTFIQKIYDIGEIYLGSYSGNYCIGCERFLTDKELIHNKCPDHNTLTQFIKEENYFFKMSSYQNDLIAHIKANPDFIRPERYRNEVLSFLKYPLEDLCISRPKSRLFWGINLPFDNRFITYVWVDALINYITGLGWPNNYLFDKYWPTAQHIIAKDILKPHAIYWPTMLMALSRAEGKPINTYLYKNLNVHGYWKIGERKISKSLGNVVNPLELAKIYGIEAFRYFCLREMTFGLDAIFSEQALIRRYNADLVNDLGNLFSRVMGMLHQYRGGIIPQPGQNTLEDQALLKILKEIAYVYEIEMKIFNFHKALNAIWNLINETNRFITLCQPWSLAKKINKKTRLDQILYLLLTKILTAIIIMISPVMPKTAQSMADYLGLNNINGKLQKIKAGEPLLISGISTIKPPILFPRLTI